MPKRTGTKTNDFDTVWIASQKLRGIAHLIENYSGEFIPVNGADTFYGLGQVLYSISVDLGETYEIMTEMKPDSSEE